MLQTKTHKYLSTRNILFLVLLLLFKCLKTQSVDEVTTSVLKFYSQKALSYSFHKQWYIRNGKTLWDFNADYCAYKEGNSIFYRLEYYIKGKDFKYDNIKSKSLYGSNVMRQASRTYKNYYTQKRDWMDGNDGDFLFCQDGNFKTIIEDKKYKIQVVDLKSMYLLELSDTSGIESNLPGLYIKNRFTKYYVSKKDGSIIKSFHSSSGIQGTDSVVFDYTYYKADRKKVMEKINSFVPLDFVDEEARRRVLIDSAEMLFRKAESVPNFDLPDTSGNTYKSTNITSKYVLIDFWYESCAPCLLNMPNVEKVRKQFSKANLEVIAVNMHDSLNKDLKKRVHKFNATHTWLFNGEELSRELNIYAYPTTIIYDNSSKKIVYRLVGAGESYVPGVTEFLKNNIPIE